ncbi:MAG: M16 family metallopeptidase, partial [Flavobacteriales bacterium]
GSSLTKHSNTLLDLMSDVLMNPTFPQEELDKLKKQTLSGLASSTTDPGSIGANISGAMTFGLDHPYGEQQTEKTTEKITRDDLVNYYSTYFRPNISYLTIVGDITKAEAEAQAKKYFGTWENKEVPKHTYEKPGFPEGNKVCFAPLAGAVQSTIEITFPVDLKPGDNDAIAASVMSNILGGGVFGGRLMQNLREDKAFTYGARCNLSKDPVIGSFSAYASVRNEVTDSSIVEFLYEIDRLTNEMVEDTTLQFIKNNMNGSFARSLESPQTIARFALNIERYGLPKDYYSSYLTKLAAVSKEDILRVAKQYLKPQNAYITVVGNKDEVADKLARFSYDGEVKFLNIYGGDYVDLKAAPEGMVAADVVNAYINAIGGADKIGKVKTLTQVGEMAMGPMSVEMTQKLVTGEKFYMSIAQGPMVFSETVYDGKKGSNSQMGQSAPMTPEELEEMKMRTDLVAELTPEKYGITNTLKGIGIHNDEEVYVVESVDAYESVTTEYYSIATGLKVRSASTESTPEGDIVLSTEFADYREVKGVKFPFQVTQMAGPQTFVVTYSSIKVNPKLSNSDFKVK